MFLFPQPVPIPVVSPPAHSFEIRDHQFQLDGKPFQILAGEMHYPRIPHQLWRQRIRMAKAMGLNTISTYVFWNLHEPEKGKFNFSGDANVAGFIKTCQEEGMYVMLRPGPYVCAEWEFGGYPYWLLKNRQMKIRSADPAFLNATQGYLKALAKQTVPLQISHGGNILMVQVENEYGSYGRDHDYMKAVRQSLTQLGFDVPLYVAEGSSQLADAWILGTVAGVNGGSWPDIVKTTDRYTPGGPYISPEFYPGWLDHWGEPKSITNGGVADYEKLIANGVSVSMYMFHGGTNFGFMNGANYGGNYQPGPPSYDYDAPLDETGRTTKKYFAFREAIQRITGHKPISVPVMPPTIRLPRITLTKTGSIYGSLPKPVLSANPPAMEDLNQAYGDVLYRTHLKSGGHVRLDILDLRDYAVVIINRKVVGNLDRRRKEHRLDLDIPSGGAELDLLVENSGRINYGGELPDNRKGITKRVTLNGVEVSEWRSYSLPLSRPDDFRLDGKSVGPSFYRGSFTVAAVGDGFLDLRGWEKGAVWVNGHNLGRYWWIGPQQTLYVPGVWLNKGTNTVTVFDLAGGSHPYLNSSAKPVLNELHLETTNPKHGRNAGGKLDLTAFRLAAKGELRPGDLPQTFPLTLHQGRYLALKTVSTFAKEDYAALSEVELIDSAGRSLDRSHWRVSYVDSEETAQEDGSAENLLDADPETIWHSVWSVAHSGQPHWVVVDLGKNVSVSSVRLIPRPGDRPAKLREFEILLADHR